MRPNGLEVLKVRVPLGVVFFIYESRPNVTADAAAICVKSGNAVILRGGKEAVHSSRAIVEILLAKRWPKSGCRSTPCNWWPRPIARRSAIFCGCREYIDLAIPRGGEGLIRRVAAEAKMPVIKHFTGNCHVYVDRAADLDMAERITINSKCQRMGVCNAAESLVVHADVAREFLPRIGAALAGARHRNSRRRANAAVHPVGDARRAKPILPPSILGPIISVKVVDSLDEAIEHINHYGSHHTEAIVTARSGGRPRVRRRGSTARR